MVRSELGWVILFLCATTRISAVKINFPGCDRAGWKCNKVQPAPIRYEIEYACQNGIGIEIVLWNFNAPAEIKHLKIVNCSSVEIDLTCTGVGRQVESLYLQNVGVFNFTKLLHSDVAQMPEEVRLENVMSMPYIPEKTFKQMKNPLASAYRCAVNTRPLEKLVFTNVGIGSIEKDAFYDLTDFKIFKWENVTVQQMGPLSINVEIGKENSFNISNSTFDKLDYKSFRIKSPEINIFNSTFGVLPLNAFDSTSFYFYFINNNIKKVQSFAFNLLSQHVTIENNKFESLKTSAFQGIGPGLLENALISFGNLLFTYTFKNNDITHADIGGLHCDFVAYQNVHSILHVTNNKLPCSCKELGWITIKNGLGDMFSNMMTFNSKVLDPKNQNLCSNCPCPLPVTVMVNMAIKFGTCSAHESLVKYCQSYKPSSPNFAYNGGSSMVLEQWSNHFNVSKKNDELPSNFFDDFDDYVTMKTESSSQKNTYFKIEKTKIDDPENVTRSSIIEQENPENNFLTAIPDIIFKDDENMDQNNTQYKYDIDVRNNTNNTSSNHKISKQEFEDNEKDLQQNTFEGWEAQRKKRMVYFKIFGNVITVDKN